MDIKDNSVIIMPYFLKNNLIQDIRKNNILLNIKFISDREFIKKYYFDYDDRAIYYLINKYNLNYEIANIYLSNIYYILDSDITDDKVLFLKSLYEDLKANNLLSFDTHFKEYLLTKNIYIYEEDRCNEILIKILKDISCSKIDKDYQDYDLPSVLEFDSVEEEIDYVACSIINLIKQGIDINNIKISGIDNNYNSILKRIFSFYNIPLSIEDNKTLYDTSIGLYFLSNLENEDILAKLKEKFDLNNINNLNIYNTIIDVINNYVWEDNFINIKELLINAFKSKKIKSNKLKNCVEVIPLEESNFDDKTYVFVMNFSLNNIPKINKDEEYLPDNLKGKLGYLKSYEINEIEKDKIIKILKNIKNLTLTYKIYDINSQYYISNLAYDLNLNVKHLLFNNYSYSNIYNKIKLSKLLDTYNKYNKKDSNLDLLYNTYPKIEYLKYDNNYKKIDPAKISKYLNNKLVLSYSSINNYYQCAFKYYLANILKLEPLDNTFFRDIGNTFHFVLSKMDNHDFDIDKYYDISKCNDKREQYFYLKLKKDLAFIIDNIKEQRKHTSFTEALYENRINIYLNDVLFTGIIDKLLYKNINNDTYVVIIDYKTGKADINLKLIDYGLNMQLPIYIYLALNYNKFNNVKLVGIYLQELLTYDKKSDLTIRGEELKLKGYSTNNHELLKLFDDTYKDSKVIKNMKLNKDNSFSYYAKVLSEDEFNNIYLKVENKIKEAIMNIKNANFDINPKIINNDNKSCIYCPYHDICYVSEDNKIYLEVGD